MKRFLLYITVVTAGSFLLITAVFAVVFVSSLTPGADNTFDVGFLGTSRFRDAHFAGSVFIGSSVAVGTSTIAANEILHLESTSKGFLAPRMTTTQRDAIATSSANGLVIFNTDKNDFDYWNGSSWSNLAGLWKASSTNLYNTNSGNIGIGTSVPSQKLTLAGGSFFEYLTATSTATVGTKNLGATTDNQIAVAGRYAYVASAGINALQIEDITNPASPAVISSTGIGSAPTGVQVSGRYAYIVDSGSDDLKIIDISNPYSPSTVATKALGSNPTALTIAGRYAYVVDSGSDDLKVIDIGNPASPTTVGTLSIGSNPTDVRITGRYAYIVDSGSDDLKIIDISNPASPTLISTKSLGSITDSRIAVVESFAYIVSATGNNLQIVNISNPASASIVSTISVGSAPTGVQIIGRYAYIVDSGSDDLKIIDISNSTAPSTVATIALGSNPTALSVSGRYAYIVDSGSDDLKVVRVGGVDATSLTTGSLQSDRLSVFGLAQADSISARASLNVGLGGIYSSGPVSIFLSTSTTASPLDIRNASGASLIYMQGNGNLGFGMTSPSSTVEVPDGSYAQFSTVSSGAPTSTDCDADSEVGRLVIATSTNRLYVCNKSSTGRSWDYAPLND